MKHLLEGIPDLLLSILYIQPRISFFLLLMIGFSFQRLPAFFHTLLFDFRDRVMDRFRAQSPEFRYVLLMLNTLGIHVESRQEDA